MKNLTERLRAHREVIVQWLAVLGVVAISLLLAWLAVTTVRLFPTAYSALTSLWDRHTSSITLSAPSLVNSGEDASLSWEGPRGTYVFSYDCIEGVSVELRGEDGRSRVACDTEVPLAEDANATTLAFSSTERRFADLRYEVRLIAENAAETLTTDGHLTIVNPTIPAQRSEASNEELSETRSDYETEEEPADNDAMEEVVLSEESAASVPASTPAPAPGVADLAVAPIALPPTLTEGELSALQFSVTNIGSVRSGIWYLDAVLPTTAPLYRSGPQEALAPGEGVLITLTFETSNTNRVSSSFVASVTVGGGNDKNSANNTLVHSVRIR